MSVFFFVFFFDPVHTGSGNLSRWRSLPITKNFSLVNTISKLHHKNKNMATPSTSSVVLNPVLSQPVSVPTPTTTTTTLPVTTLGIAPPVTVLSVPIRQTDYNIRETRGPYKKPAMPLVAVDRKPLPNLVKTLMYQQECALRWTKETKRSSSELMHDNLFALKKASRLVTIVVETKEDKKKDAIEPTLLCSSWPMKPLDGSEEEEDNLVACDSSGNSSDCPSSHGLINLLKTAFSTHRPLKLGPEVFSLLASQQYELHMRQHHERLRKTMVGDLVGKRILRVTGLPESADALRSPDTWRATITA
jgi:hypothetical protein